MVESKLYVLKLRGFVIDEVGIMIGKRNGVFFKFREEFKLLLSMYCICYYVALVCNDVNDDVVYN